MNVAKRLPNRFMLKHLNLFVTAWVSFAKLFVYFVNVNFVNEE
jgi:hypothetical protein